MLIEQWTKVNVTTIERDGVDRTIVVASETPTKSISTRTTAPELKRPRSARRAPDAFDVYVGQRLRQARVLRSISQECLAEAAGITFQQVQKYEKGTNRIAPSRLKDSAAALSVGPGWFFETEPALIGKRRHVDDASLALPTVTAKDLRLASKIGRLEPSVHQKLAGLIEALSATP